MHNLADFTDRITATGYQPDTAGILIATPATRTSCTFDAEYRPVSDRAKPTLMMAMASRTGFLNK